MGELNSAFDIAMERARRLGEASPEEVRKRDLVPEGERLAARYLRDEGGLAAELSNYDDEARRYVIEGAGGIFLRNIDLPRSDVAKGISKRAMEGVKILKGDKGGVENVYSKMRRLFKYYEQEGEQQRREAYEAFKGEFLARLGQEHQRRGLPAPVSADVEGQPQFQEQWGRALVQLDEQYYKLLEEYKRELEGIA
jgi:hypothetical protein